MPRLIGPGLMIGLTVVTGLASGGQALATHVQCGDVITQDTTLDSDLLDCPGDGIVIGADNITLDLGGHAIDGSADRPETGIDNDAGHDGVEIERGRVQGFRNGVRLVGASEGRVRRLTVSDNAPYGISLDSSERNVIEESAGTGNSVAIQLDRSHGNRVQHNVLPGNGIAVVSSNDNRVVENQLAGIVVQGDSANDLVAQNSVSNPGISAIYVGGSGHRIERNIITGSGPGGNYGSRGIDLHGAVNTKVARNSVSDHDYGIYCINSTGGKFEHNVVHDNFREGIVTVVCHATQIERNKVVHNGVVGITLAASRNGQVERNHVHGNRHGISFQESSDSRMEGNIVTDSQEEGIHAYWGSNNWIARNKVFRNGYRGVLVSDDDDDVERNVVYDNGLDGMLVLRNGNHVRGNVIHDNRGSGLSFGATTGRIEGNVIFGNRRSGMRGFLSEGVISANAVYDNRRDGIFISEGPTALVITLNRVHRNGGDGIDVDSPGAELADNSANRNGDLGIEGVPGVIDGGGNGARQNGNSLQCLYVDCR